MQDQSSPRTGTLYVVATPIGNLEDITLRALRILKEVDYAAAEDTRHTRKLFSHFGISTRLISYYREKEQHRADKIIELLMAGNDVALVSDAGTPAIADPGGILVRHALEREISVVPIPGASALTTTLSCAGIDERPVMFYGFAPAKQAKRIEVLAELIHSRHYAVFYESPHRITNFVADALDQLGDREVFLARELTKTFEELRLTTLGNLQKQVEAGKNRGEFVVVLAPAETAPPAEMDLDQLILWYRTNSQLSLKDCCKTLAADLGISRSKIYQRALQLWH